MNSLATFYCGKQVLITGGAGFIGSIVAKQLVEAGAIVTIMDDFSQGNINNLKSILDHIIILPHSITSFAACLAATQNKTHVFHLAAAISVVESQQHPEKYDLINVIGTQNLLEAATQQGVQNFVFSSSAAVYGNHEGACTETTPLNPQSHYAITKIKGEELCYKFHNPNQLNSTVLRYFNVFGPHQSASSPYAAVVPIFTQRILAQQPLTIFGTGMQTRDFVHVEEVARANLLVGTQRYHQSEVFNVASGRSKNLFQLIDELTRTLQCAKPIINFMPARPGDVEHSSAICDKLKALAQRTEGLL